MIVCPGMKKTILGLALLASAFLLAGCDSISDRLEGDTPPRVQVIQADPRTTFAAARTALDGIGFRFTHGGPAEGLMEAIGPIEPGDLPGSSHQVSLRAEFHPTLDGKSTQVDVWLRDAVEQDPEDKLHPATEAPMPDTPLYEVFFREIAQNLPSGAK
jgi:hypothetical protein